MVFVAAGGELRDRNIASSRFIGFIGSCSMPVDEFGRTVLKKETVQGGGECNSVVIQLRLVWDLVYLQYPANQLVGIWWKQLQIMGFMKEANMEMYCEH